LSRFDVLRVRQRQVADLVLRGLSNDAIATKLGISTRTVESHVADVCAQIGVTTRTELMAIRIAELQRTIAKHSDSGGT